MRVIETKVYTIDEHPNPEKVFNWIRNNWHDLNDHSVDEVMESINTLSETIGGTVDYRISSAPDRGEFIRFKEYDRNALMDLDVDKCPLTGVCWDADIIEGLRDNDPGRVLRCLHSDTEYLYSDEGLRGLCEGNEYEFDESGKIA